jgi:hypothetical protein
MTAELDLTFSIQKKKKKKKRVPFATSLHLPFFSLRNKRKKLNPVLGCDYALVCTLPLFPLHFHMGFLF